jgi:phage baseplate assembly protein W
MKNTEIALSFPFSLDTLGNLNISFSQDKIWADRVKMAIGTTIGERVMRPEYGTQIANAAFNTGSFMESTITKEIEKVFNDLLPLLKLIDVSFQYTAVTNTLVSTIVYELPNKKEATVEVGVVVVSTNNSPYEELS